MVDLIILILIPTLFIALIIRYRKQVRWLLTPFAWFKDIIDPQWWANFIGNKQDYFNVQEIIDIDDG